MKIRKKTLHSHSPKVSLSISIAKLVGLLLLIVPLLGLGTDAASSWSKTGPTSAYFTTSETGLTLVPENLPWYASLWMATEGFVTEEDLRPFQAQVDILLSTGFTLKIGEQAYSFPAQMKDLLLTKVNTSSTLSLTEEFLNYILETAAAKTKVPAGNIRILEADDSQTSKATLEGDISNGIEVVNDLTEELILSAIQNGLTEATGATRILEGQIINESGKDLGPLKFLAEGRSSFQKSIDQRAFNVRKALNERYDGILIPPGAEFSYVSFLGPITKEEGWKFSLAIFKGTETEWVRGGGICKISTTVYRAMLNAALQVTEQRNHSLYVDYYEMYGVGLDATVFPGEQDLKFINDTPNYLLMIAEEEANMEAVIRFYGEDDGRSVELFGPYTHSNQTDEVVAAVGSLGSGMIAWKYRITRPDGTVEEKWLKSTYFSPVRQQ